MPGGPSLIDLIRSAGTGGLHPDVLRMLLSQPSHEAQSGQLETLRGQIPMTDPMQLMLRDWHHQAFTRGIMERFGPVLGRMIAGSGIPLWQVMKMLSQNVPGGRQASQYLPQSLQPHLGTPPTWGQLGTGLRPLLSRLPSPSQVPVPPGLSGAGP